MVRSKISSIALLKQSCQYFHKNSRRILLLHLQFCVGLLISVGIFALFFDNLFTKRGQKFDEVIIMAIIFLLIPLTYFWLRSALFIAISQSILEEHPLINNLSRVELILKYAGLDFLFSLLLCGSFFLGSITYEHVGYQLFLEPSKYWDTLLVPATISLFYVRFIPMFPALVDSKDLNFSQALKKTKGLFWRSAGISGVFLIIFLGLLTGAKIWGETLLLMLGLLILHIVPSTFTTILGAYLYKNHRG